VSDKKGGPKAALSLAAATIVRPVTFMEMLVMPGFGLDEGRFSFFAKPDQSMRFPAVEDIGKFVATIFAEPAPGNTLTRNDRPRQPLLSDAEGGWVDASKARRPSIEGWVLSPKAGICAGKADR
jgi:hypothetical protein